MLMKKDTESDYFRNQAGLEYRGRMNAEIEAKKWKERAERYYEQVQKQENHD